MKRLNLTGQRFGRLTVEGPAGKDKSGHTTWLCKCDCGKETTARGSHLKIGYIQSCGCLAIDTLRKNSTKHGLEHTRIYRIWKNMLSRCYNPKNNRYHRYGERGIVVCKEWKENLLSFRDWAISNGYKDNLTIERIDNNGPYTPENCRWATAKEQANHTSANRYITIKGETKTVSQWAEAYGIATGTVFGRLGSGWKPEKAVTEPVVRRKAGDI